LAALRETYSALSYLTARGGLGAATAGSGGFPAWIHALAITDAAAVIAPLIRRSITGCARSKNFSKYSLS
jgi:hypothetical protein